MKLMSGVPGNEGSAHATDLLDSLKASDKILLLLSPIVDIGIPGRLQVRLVQIADQLGNKLIVRYAGGSREVEFFVYFFPDVRC